MNKRIIIIVGGLFLVATAGFATYAFWPERLPLNTHKPPPDVPYPVRKDWLAVTVPSGKQPTHWHVGGNTPLWVLQQKPLDQLKDEETLLIYHVQNREILDTRRVGPALRDEFLKTLTELFGTPMFPKVPDGEWLIERLKLEEELTALRRQQQEAAAALSGAKTPDEKVEAKQLADGLDEESRVGEDSLKRLRSYVHELKLDSDTLKRGSVLFGQYCVSCHGATGDGSGNGSIATRLLQPLPRDYRQGLFKFMTTDPKLGGKRKPSRDDLWHTIYYGTEEATKMPQFSLKFKDHDADLQDIISFVIHLSMRGETEYELMKIAADPGADELTPDDLRNGLIAQAASIALLWSVSAGSKIIPDPNPFTTDEQKLDSAARGYALFTSREVGCIGCHVDFGQKAPFMFDSWGSITRPRNLTQPMFCAGRNPDQIYARIYGGILGSNMPSFAQLRPSAAELAKGQNKIWDLVHFVRYVSDPETRVLLKEKKKIDIHVEKIDEPVKR